MSSRKLKLIVLENIKEIGQNINEHLKELNNNDKDFIIEIEASRFSNGEGKIKLQNSVRDSDVYIISDVGNYGITYSMHGRIHEMSPDEHFQDIKRVISAMSGNAEKMHLIMPLLYQSRQHKRKGRESLDCAIALQELERIGITDIISFDVHAPDVSNAIPNLPFENIYPTNVVLDYFIQNEQDIKDNLLVISPDMGAMERAKYYAEILGCDVGAFYKRRDLTKVINGKNPIIEHVYLGTDVKDKNIIITDDMIASGKTMIEVAQDLKQRGALNIYFIASFALFTEGYELFNEAYKLGLFNKVYSTNLSYVPQDIKEQEWYKEVDCSKLIAQLIYDINKGNSLEAYYKPNKDLMKKVRRR